MIWHVRSGDFVQYLISQGFKLVGRTNRHDIFERNGIRIQVRRSDSLTQAEVDAISDAADLQTPQLETWFGD